MYVQELYSYINRQVTDSKRRISRVVKMIQICVCVILPICVLPRSVAIKIIAIVTDTTILLFYFKIIEKVVLKEIRRINKQFTFLPSKEKECISKYVSQKVIE